MKIWIEDKQNFVELNKKKIREVVRSTLTAEDSNKGVNLIYVDNTEIKRLNNKARIRLLKI